MDRAFRAVAAVVFVGALGSGETAQAYGPLTASHDQREGARADILRDSQAACGNAASGAARASADYRAASLRFDRARTQDDQDYAREEMVRISGDWSVRLVEIRTGLQDQIARQFSYLPRREVENEIDSVPALIAACARSGQ